MVTHRLSWTFCSLAIAILGCLALCFLLAGAGAAAVVQPLDVPPLGEHCGDVGPLPSPLPPDWCGCVWGAVYVEGVPMTRVVVTLAHASSVIAFATTDAYWDTPYYALDGYWVDLCYGDPVTLTADLMDDFYRALLRGETVAGALRTAQLSTLFRRPHTYYWAAFAVWGGGLMECLVRFLGLLCFDGGKTGCKWFIIVKRQSSRASHRHVVIRITWGSKRKLGWLVT